MVLLTSENNKTTKDWLTNRPLRTRLTRAAGSKFGGLLGRGVNLLLVDGPWPPACDRLPFDKWNVLFAEMKKKKQKWVAWPL